MLPNSPLASGYQVLGGPDAVRDRSVYHDLSFGVADLFAVRAAKLAAV
jgi:hypothetical protein